MARKRTNYFYKANGLIEHRFYYNGERFSVYGRTMDDIETKKDEKIAQLEAGLRGDCSNFTVDRYYDLWQKERAANGDVKASTVYGGSEKYGRAAKIIGSCKVKDVTPATIKKVKSELVKRGLCTTTINDTLVLLRCLFKSAVNDKIISESPCKGIANLKRKEAAAAQTIHRALTIEEQEAFFNEAKASCWYYELYSFLIQTGLRVGEAAALTWKDVDLNKRVIHVRKSLDRVSNTKWVIDTPKTKTSVRDIPISRGIEKTLLEQKAKSSIARIDNIVFTSPYGDYIKHTSVNNCITNILKKLDEKGTPIEHFSVHALRDTFATRCIEQGMNPQTLKTILGHSSLSMTMDLYAHVLPDTKERELSKIMISV